MKELFTSSDSSRIGLCQSVLDSAGIVSFVQNESSPWLGNMMSPAVQPTLCLMDDSRYEEAVELLKPYQGSSRIESMEWTCTKCGESNPDSFDVCWHCEVEKPENFRALDA
jgi:hypothetical protein